MGIQKTTWKNETLKYMYVQDVVEKKLTNFAHINTNQNKANLMTKCHTSEAHKRVDAMIGWRLASNRIKKYKSNTKMKQRGATREEVNQQ